MDRAKISRVLLAIISCASLAPLSAGTSPLMAQSPATIAAIDSTLRQLFDLGAAPGLGVAIVKDTQIIYMKGFGFADVEKKRPVTGSTQFYIASNTKSFTGLAAEILAERGTWDLDAPLSRYLPELKLKSPLNADSITIRSLLTHTHGIGNGGPVVMRLAFTGEYANDAELIRLLAEHPAAKSGRQFAYGNIGYNVAALAMDKLTRESWKETLRRLLFEPLGMKSTTAYASKVPADRIAVPYTLSANGFVRTHAGKSDANMQSAGGLFSTLSDMSRWIEVHINNGKLDGRQILPAKAVMESHKNGATMDRTFRGLRQIGYGFGWNIMLRGQDTLYTHGGGFIGYATHMSFMPQQRVGIVAMANEGELGGGLVELAASSIYDVLRTGKPIDSAMMSQIKADLARTNTRKAEDFARRAARPQTLQFPLQAYVGTYVNPLWGTLVISQVKDKLEARAGAAWTAVEVYDATKNQLRLELFGNGEVAEVAMVDGKAATINLSGIEFKRK